MPEQEQEQQTTPETQEPETQEPETQQPSEELPPQEPTQAEPVSLAEAKQQLRVEFTEDDTLIQGYITAAREICESFLNVPLVAAEGEEPPTVKQSWKQAILLAVANWYQNREQGAFPEAAYQLLWFDRVVPV